MNNNSNRDVIEVVDISSDDDDVSKEFLNIPEYTNSSMHRDNETFRHIPHKTSTRIDIIFESPSPTRLQRYKTLNFHVDSDGYVHVYTAGSFIKNASSAYGIHFGVDHKLNQTKIIKELGDNSGIIQAVIDAIENAELFSIQKLKIFIDSIIKRRISIWKTKSSAALKRNGTNIDHFEYLENILDKTNMIVKFCYIQNSSDKKFIYK